MAAQVAEDKRGMDVVVLDLRNLTIVTDFFVLASADTALQVRAIAEGIVELLAEQGVNYLHREGWDDARWVLLDYGSTVVHIFRREEREYYALDRLWGDAPRLSVTESAALAATRS